jgi:hypothetical protein
MADGYNDERSSTSPAARERRNTLWLECYQVVVRVGWIFKTETIIMPAVLDAVVDSGLLRGLLPVLNRGGQSLPPLAFSAALARRPVKKWTLVRTTLAMAACFAVLAAVWTPLQAARPDILAVVFLVVYAAFSSANGLTQLAAAALQGKLIAPGHRGRAMVVSVAVGSVLAIVAALLLLGPWLGQPNGFPKIFAVTALFFAIAAFVPALLDEPADPVETRPVPAAPSPMRGAASRAGGGRWPAIRRSCDCASSPPASRPCSCSFRTTRPSPATASAAAWAAC